MVAKDIFYYSRNFKMLLYKIISKIIYASFFYAWGKKSKIVHPLNIKNAKYISIGNRVTINDSVFLMAEVNDVTSRDPRVIIRDGVTIGNYNHIVGLNSVIIDENVLTADRVYISDNYHGYEDIHTPISHQPIKSKRGVHIGKSTWIGENVSIISSHIGEHCIIAANSVVISDVPDYCMVAGAPAVIKKRYSHEKGVWIKDE